MSLAAQQTQPSMLRLTLACELAEVRPASMALRAFLSDHGFAEDTLMACELAFVEAGNNAVAYVQESQRAKPIVVEAICDATTVELRVNDHTPGFDWPTEALLPENESESGRGLFLIQSLMDEATYLRGPHGNCLLMRRSSPSPHAARSAEAATLEELKGRLLESNQIIHDMAEELSSCYESLSAIFRYSSELGKTDNLEDFSQRLLGQLLQITGADWFVLRMIGVEDENLVLFATSSPLFKLPPIQVAPADSHAGVEAEAVATRQDVWFDRHRPQTASDPLRQVISGMSGLVHPFYFGDTLFGTIAVGRSSSFRPFTAAQTNVIHTFADFLAIQLVNARFQEEQVRTRVVTRELEIAENIQRSLLPKSVPQLPGFQLAGVCVSARQVGGDFYDVIRTADDGALLAIADVMGKGIPAAMFAAILRSLLRAVPELVRQPAALLTRINRLLYEELSSVDMFITAQLAFIDAPRRRLITANAGHCPLLLASAGHEAVSAISPEGMPLGVLPDTEFAEEVRELKPGSRALLYTDGLSEARNHEGELYGQQRLMDWLKASTTRTDAASVLIETLTRELTEYRGDTPLHDDLTFLIVAEAGRASL